MCFVFIWEQTATCATYSINWLVFITEMKSVYCAVRTASLNKAVCASFLKDQCERFCRASGNTCHWPGLKSYPAHAKVLSCHSPCGICGGRVRTDGFFPPIVSVLPYQLLFHSLRCCRHGNELAGSLKQASNLDEELWACRGLWQPFFPGASLAVASSVSVDKCA